MDRPPTRSRSSQHMTESNALTSKRNRYDPRHIRTRQALLSAGRKLMSAHGTENLAIDELVRAAGISKQSFYNHFSSKEHLTTEILHLARQEIEAIVDLVNDQESDPAVRVARAMCVHARRAIDSPSQGHLIAKMLIQDASADTELNRGVKSDVSAGLDQGRLQAFSLDTGVSYIAAITQALVERIMKGKGFRNAVAASQQYVTLLLRAFGLSFAESQQIAIRSVQAIVRKKKQTNRPALRDTLKPAR